MLSSRALLRVLAPAVIGLFLPGAVLHAQINRGVIEGVVTDPAGAVVADAEITVTAVDTNTVVPARTNATGYYRAGDLVPGKYTALIKSPGFSTLDLRNIEVSGGSVTRVDAQLRLDATRQTVQVNAEAPLVDSSAANVSTTVDTAIIQEIPLQGRDLQQLTFLIPGVNNVGGPPGSNFGFNSQFGTFPDPSNSLGSNIAVNGGQGGANAWYLDGSLNLSSFAENVVINPTPDAVQEFQAITTGLAAEYGRSGGGVFSVVLKSGTNAYHGDGYWFLRNDATNARNPFTSIDTEGKLIKDRQLRFNNFGGTVGGPVSIPKLYNGKDKTFFFYSLDKTVLHLLGSQTFTVPTARMRNGDFSEDPNVVNYGIADPFSTIGPDSNGLFQRQKFTNTGGGLATSLPTSRLDPIAMYYMKSFPLPNYNSPLSGCPMGKDGYLVCDNFLGSVGSSQNPLKSSLKIDHQLSEKSRFFAEWLYSPVPYRNYRVPWTGATFPWDQTGYGARYPVDFTSNIIALGNTYSFRPTLINEFRLSFSRQYMTTNPSHPYPDSITDQTNVQAQLVAAKIPSDPYFPLPHFGIDGPGGGHMSFGPQTWVNMNTAAEAYTILDNVTKIIGKHTVKAGFIYRLEHSVYESGFPTGFNFRNGGTTSDPITGLGGNGLAQFMLGAVTNSGRDASTGVMWTPYERFRYWGFFAQDDFRLTKNLTLNVGLRYDINGLYRVRTGNATNFCLSCVNPLTGLPGQMVFEGSPQFPKGDIAPANKNSIAPRFNFSWAPTADRKTVVRGGYDVFYSNAFSMINSPGQAAANAPGWNQEFDWQGSFYPNQCAPRSGQCVAFPLSDQTTDKNSLTTPPRAAGFPAARQDPLLGGFIQFFTPPSRDPMVQTWHLELQRELPGDMMLSVGYVGNHGTHLVGEAFRQYNFVHTADKLKFRNQLNATVPITNYFSGATADALTKIWGPETQLSQLLMDYPAFGGIQNNVAFDGTSIYHGMNVRVQKRLSHGFEFIAAYTFSKKITDVQTTNMATMLVNPLSYARSGGVGGRYGATGGIYGSNYQDIDNKAADRAVAADDIPHMLNLVASYQLPFGKGRAFLNQGGAVNAILGGWHLTSNFNAASGIPMGVGCPGNEITSRCDLVGPISVGKGDKQQRTAQWINPSSFSPPFGTDQSFWANYDPTDNRAWQFGSAGPLLPGLRSPGYWNVDSSLSKQFHFAEQKYVEFRWEVFNTLNHMNLGLPNTGFCLPALPDGTTDRVHQAGCSFGRITNIQTDPRAMEFALKLFF